MRDNWRLWQSAGEGCASAAGASLPANTQCWCAGGNPRGNCIFSYPWENHKVSTYGIFSYQHLLVFSSDAGIILHRALDMRLIYWEHQNKVGKTGVPLGHVSVSFCNIRSVNFHLCHYKDTRNKPQSKDSMPTGAGAPRSLWTPHHGWTPLPQWMRNGRQPSTCWW